MSSNGDDGLRKEKQVRRSSLQTAVLSNDIAKMTSSQDVDSSATTDAVH